jgi:hypothetical protein
MHTTIITIHFSLAWGTCIRHGNIICTGTSVADWAVLRCVFRACIGIGWAASGATCEFRGNIGTWLLGSIAVVLRVVYRLRRSHLLLLCLSASFLESSFKAIFHTLSGSAAALGNLNSCHIYLRSLFSQNGLIKFLVIIAPPLRVN